jgi:CDP-diacylglycerol--glycerol-3-phosphate 3-phosphatidyltransferase
LINLPTVLTVSRILLILPFVLIAYDYPFIGALLFALAAATDSLDGYIARKTKQITKLGILLDPIADKLLVITALVVLVDMAMVPAWIAIVIIAREFIVTGLRIAALSKDMVIPAETGGKIKTMSQIIAIITMFVDRSVGVVDLYGLGIFTLWVAMILGVISGVKYFILFWKSI